MTEGSMFKRRAGQILLVLGFTALIIGAWSGAQYRTATALRLFFVAPFGLATSSDGLIYVGVDGRDVHAYEASGRPVGAWTVAHDAGRFRLRARQDGLIEVAREIPAERVVYNVQGEVIERVPEPGVFERFGPDQDHRLALGDNLLFEITDEGLVRTQDGERVLVVAVPQIPLAWLGHRPVRQLVALLFLGTMGLLGGTLLTAASTRPAPSSSPESVR